MASDQNDFSKGSIVRNIINLAVPMTLAQLINVLYNVVDRIYINFCNPWPKKKHKKKRLTYPRQLFFYQEFLKNGGEIWFKTDDDELFEESLTYFNMCGFTQEYITYDLAASGFAENIVTEHENMFMEQGIKIKFLIAKNHGRVSALPPIVPKESETEENQES